MFLDQRDGALDRALVAREHDLAGIVVVGDGADFTLCRSIGQRLRLVDVGAEQRRHGADADGHGGLHRLPAQLQQARGVGQAESPGGAERGIFAKAVAGDEIALVGQADAAFLLEHAQHRDGIGHDRRLGVFGQRQLILWPFAHDRRELLAERVVDFLEHLARGGAGFGEFGTHADFLAALTGKYEGTHGRPLLRM